MRPMFLSMVLLLAASGWAPRGAAALPPVPLEAKGEFGTTSGTPQMTGFVFVDGRYLNPPYTVSRVGNGLFINRIQIEQPVPWSRFEPGPETEKDGKKPEPPAEDGPAPAPAPDAGKSVEKPAAPAADGDFTDAPAAPAEKSVTEALDELFGDDDDGDGAPAPAPSAAGKTGAGPEDAEGPGAGDAGGKGPAPKTPALKAPARRLTPKEIAAAKKKLLAYLEKKRRVYELGLARKEVFFFGESHNRINGNYGSARMLFEILPDALRTAASPGDLLEQLHRGGVYFIDLRVARLIFKNKVTYPMLKDRLKKIRFEEKIEAERRRRLREAGPSY